MLQTNKKWQWISYEKLFITISVLRASKKKKKKKEGVIHLQRDEFIIFVYLHVKLLCFLKDDNWLRRKYEGS